MQQVSWTKVTIDSGLVGWGEGGFVSLPRPTNPSQRVQNDQPPGGIFCEGPRTERAKEPPRLRSWEAAEKAQTKKGLGHLDSTTVGEYLPR